MTDELREQLQQVENELRGLRDERSRASKVADSALAAFADHESEESLKTVKQAKESLQAVGLKLEKASDRQAELLRRLADRESGVAGFSSPNLNGWQQAAQTLSISDSQLYAQTSASALLRSSISRPAVRQVDVTAPVNSRYLYPVFSSAPFGGSGDLVATDFVISFTEGAITGVEIPPASSTQKAELPVTVTLATPTAKVFAIVADDVPAKLFESRPALGAYLDSEMRRRLDVAYDDHVVAAIEGASPPSGLTGTGLVAQIRNAIADHRDLGSNPRYLALTSAQAATLDLSEDTGGSYVFRVDLEGSSSPVWSLRVREADVAAPLLVDPDKLGLSYLGGGSVLVDPYSSMKTNQVSIRVETEGKFHVRDIRGAFQIV